jgi:hypothetical protein
LVSAQADRLPNSAGQFRPDDEAVVLSKGVDMAIDALGVASPGSLPSKKPVNIICGELLEPQPCFAHPSKDEDEIIGTRLHRESG